MIGLALAGGSVRGAYEAGAYLAFKKCHIKIDGFVGTSIGSFNAAMLAAGRGHELVNFWRHVDVAKMLKLDDNFVSSLQNKNLKGTILGIKQIITNKGVSTVGLKEILEKDIRQSKKDFGLVTVKIKPLKAIYKFKEDIPEGKMNDYILGSCYYPIFKLEKIIDDEYYIDGGFYDEMPVNMLLDKNYDLVYAIDLKSVGIMQKIKDPKRTIIIKPSHNLGKLFTLDSQRINYNIKLGYYDTLKVLKNLDGKKYIFKKEKLETYTKMLKNTSDKKLKEIMQFFHHQKDKDLIIAAIEYFMQKEKYEYNRVYNIKRVIKKLKRKKLKPYGIYRFIANLKI